MSKWVKKSVKSEDKKEKSGFLIILALLLFVIGGSAALSLFSNLGKIPAHLSLILIAYFVFIRGGMSEIKTRTRFQSRVIRSVTWKGIPSKILGISSVMLGVELVLFTFISYFYKPLTREFLMLFFLTLSLMHFYMAFLIFSGKIKKETIKIYNVIGRMETEYERQFSKDDAIVPASVALAYLVLSVISYLFSEIVLAIIYSLGRVS